MNAMLLKLERLNLCSLFILVLLLSLVLAKGVEAAAIYTPGETLNPSCLPTNTDCTVTPPMVASIGTTLSNQTISGDLNTILNIGNSSLVNSGLTITAGSGLSGGGLVNLGETISLALSNIGSSGTYGSALIVPVLTIDRQGRITNVTPTAISGLGIGNFSSANISQWTNNSGYITASVGTTLTNKTISGNTNNILNIGNSSITNPEVTVVAGVGLSGGGTVYLGETVTLRLPNIGTSATYGGLKEIPVFTTDAQGRITNVTNTEISGLVASNLTAGDFSSVINTGSYSINILGVASTATSFSGSLSGDVSGGQETTSVDKIKGVTLGITTATAGNLLIGDTNGTSWVSRAMSGEATINSLGGITLNYAAGVPADATHKGFLTAADWLIFSGKQNALGYTPENFSNKSTEATLAVEGSASDVLYPSQKAVKTYVDNLSLGLKWQEPVQFIEMVGDTNAPPAVPVNNDVYIINTGGNTGAWAGFNVGDAVQYQTDHWVFLKAMAVGDRFGVGFMTDTLAVGSVVGQSNYLATISGGTSGAFTYSFLAPENNFAVFVTNQNAYRHAMALTYTTDLTAWVQLSASVAYAFGNGLSTIGVNIALSGLTADWNQTGLFNINTAGNINIEGGSLGTTAPTANLFNSGATTLNIGGAASTINVGSSGGAIITGNGALTINSKTDSALIIDSGTTGNVKIGTGAFAKAISIGNTNASTTLSLNGGVLWSIDSIGNLTTEGNISTTLTGTITSANGLTVLSGGVSLPTGSISNTNLANSSATINSGVGLSGGGTVSLGGNVTLNLANIGTSGTYGSANDIPVLTVDAQGRITSVTNTPMTATNLNGATLGVTTATAGNLLIGSGTTWESVSMSGEATINSLGGITLNYASGQSADGTHKGFLTAVDWLTFNGKQDSLGYTAENNTNKSTEVTLTVGGTASDVLYPSQNAVKTYVDNLSLGLKWQDPVQIINVVGDTNAPPVSNVNLDVYIINTDGNTGAWSGFNVGDMVQYQTDNWVFIKAMAVGDKFGVAFATATTPYSSMTGKKNYLAEITGGTTGAFTYTFTAPENNFATFVSNQNAYYHDVSFTYSTSLTAWVQLSASVAYAFGNGLSTIGTNIALSGLTADWNQTGLFNINTAGNINLNGGSLNTTATAANLFNSGATTLNIGGAASTINVGSSGGATITGNGELIINSKTDSALIIDSGTTGDVKIGTGAYAKTISIGNTNASTTLSLNGGVLWSINSAGDLTTTGSVSTTGTGIITSAGLLTASNGLTVLSGGVSLPAGSIINNALVNSSITVTAGVGLSGGGTVALGGTTNFALNLGSSNVWTGLQTFDSLAVGSSNLITNLNSNYLNGISSAGFVGIGQTGEFVGIGQTGNFVTIGSTGDFVGIGQTGNFITTLTNGNGINITGSGTSRSIGISSPTCAGTDKLQWTGSAFICSVDIGSSYSAGIGLTLSSGNVFALNLGASNVWTGLQTFGNLTIGGTFVSVGSTNLVTNLNANYLNGIASSEFVGVGQTGGFVGIGQTGSLPYVYNVTDSSLTRSGSGPYTIALNLGNSNVWTGLQTFTGGIGVSGTVNLPAGSINNATLVNSSITVTAGMGMSGGGTVALGGTMAVTVNLTTSGTIGTTASNSGLEVSASGLTLLKGCSDGQVLKYTDAGGWACAADTSGGASALNSLTAADGTNSINNGDNQQAWNWNMTSASKTAFTFGENTASTNGVASQYLVGISTVAGSTAAPLKVSARGNIILDTTSAGGLTFGNTTANTPITLQSGTGAINIGTDANAKTISIGNTVGATAINISSGTGGINIGTGAVAKTISIGTGAAANTLVIGSTNTTSATTIQSGTGNITFRVDGTNSSGQVIIGNSGTTAPDLLVLDNGTTDPTGTNGAMYYNTGLNKFRCYENGVWTNCVRAGSNLQHVVSYPTSDADFNIGTGTSTVATVSVTPATATGDVYVRASVNVVSGSGTDQVLTLTLKNGTCAGGTTVTTNTFTVTNGNNVVAGTYETSGVLVNPGTSAITFNLCASATGAITHLRIREMVADVIDTGADLAEIYTTSDSSLEIGDVVSLDSDLKTGVKKSQKAYDGGVLGVISSKPGVLIGDVDVEGVKALPVALSGRVPVKVNSENGPIKAGDPLTSSSTPGVAMKATKAGAIIGTAMSDFDGEEIGQVLMFIKNGSGNGTKIADLLPGVDENSVDFAKQILNELMWQKDNLVLTDLSEIITDRLVAGVEIITPKIVTDKTQTKNLCVGEEGDETCITKSQLDQILSKFEIGDTTPPPIITPTPTGVGLTLDTTSLTE